MIDLMKEKIIINWKDWLDHFDKFVEYNPRDPDETMWEYRDRHSYCTWEVIDDKLFTISYRYVHCIDNDGNMYCLQINSEKKKDSLKYFQILYENTKSSLLPIFEESIISYINDIELCYTKFSSPTNTLTDPGAYNIFYIMLFSNDVVGDFKAYMETVINNHIQLNEDCKRLNLPFYENYYLTVNHFADKNNFYFKDTLFDRITDRNIDSILYIEKMWDNTLKGFQDTQAIMSAYKSRDDSKPLILDLLNKEIDNLRIYSRNQCQKLKT
jgi:hypothetical protein